MPSLTGVLETALYVDDLERSIQFYQKIFSFDPLVSDQRLCALSVSAKQVLLLFKKKASLQQGQTSGGTIPPHDGDGNLHLAFSISATELESWEKWLEKNKIPIENKVRWERGGLSLYFRDPDQHLIELVTPGCWAIY